MPFQSPQVPLSRGVRLVVLGGVLVHLVLVAATCATWNHQHDEGITYDVALVEWVEDWRSEEVHTLRSLRAQVDGTRVASRAAVVEALADPTRMPHPPAFYLLWNGWARLAGTHTVPTRGPLLALSALTVLGIAALARRLVPHPSAAAWAAGLAAVNPWLVELASFLRPYTLALCAAVWGTVLVMRVASHSRRLGDVLSFALVSLVGLYSVYHYLFVFLWHLVLLTIATWRSEPRPRVRPTYVALLVVIAGYAPWFSRFLVHGFSNRVGGSFFSGVVPLAEWPLRFGLMLERYVVGQEFPAYPLAWLLGLATLIPIARALRRPRPSRVANIAWWTAILLPLSIQLADLVQRTGTLMVAKYSFGLFPLLVLLIVRAWTCGASPRAARAGLALTAALCLAATAHQLWSARARPGHVRLLVEELSLEDRASHLVVLSRPTRGHVLPLLIEARERDLRSARVAISPSTRLVPLVRKALASPNTSRLTLVNFVAGDPAYETRWPRETLARVRRVARRAGWETRTCRAERLASEPLRGDRCLTIVSPVRASTYHRPRLGVRSQGIAEPLADPVVEGGGESPAAGAGRSAPPAREVSCGGGPGERIAVALNGGTITLTTPADEGHSIGTLVIARDGDATAPLAIERDGTLESAWVCDLDADGREELLLVVRGAGSGSFPTLLLLRDEPESFAVERLPGPVPGRLDGYRRGGRVDVRGDRIALTYLRYGEGFGLVDDPVRAVLDGELPVRTGDDSMADPRGGEVSVVLDLATGFWR